MNRAPFVVLMLAVSGAQADTALYVDVNCLGPGNGSEAEPYCSIQTAIDNAVDTDEIVVAPGTYFETIGFLGKAITLRSSDGPDVTTIDAQRTGTVVICGGEGIEAALDGFTITGGEAAGFGGGLIGNNAFISNCRFVANHSESNAGGVAIWGGTQVLTNCVFEGNMSGHVGGGFWSIFAEVTLIGCTFKGNTAEWTGGLASELSEAMIIGCTFSGNSSEQGGAIFNHNGPFPTVINCIVWGNGCPSEVNPPVTVLFSNVQGGFPGIGNIDADPMFVDPDNGDFRLQAGSPCIDAGDSTAVPKEVLRDLDGNPRFVADACAGADGATVDMGAYEFQGTSCDLSDVASMLAAWGRCDDCHGCRYDFDGDCSVGILDLLALLPKPPPR